MTLLTEQLPKPAPVRWTKQEFHRLVELGGFRGRRVFVHRGELIEMPPMGWRHMQGVFKVSRWLQHRFPLLGVTVQMPFEGPEGYTPEPDAALMTLEAAAKFPRPDTALLVVEVSDNSLELDRELAVVYASANVQEYWLLNVVDRQLEVYRGVVADPLSDTGFGYAPPQVLSEKDKIAPLADPSAVITVAEILP